MLKLKGTLLASLLATLSVTSAVATEVEPVAQHSITVKFGDLNLDREADVRTLYGRLERASRNVCAEVWGREIAYARPRNQCVSAVLSRAVDDVKHPRKAQVALLAKR